MTSGRPRPTARLAGPSIHRLVLASLGRLSREAPAVKVARIAKDAGKDPRTVMHHLELLEASGGVVFLDADRSVAAVPENLAKALRNAAIEPWERAGLEDLRAIWDNEGDDVFNDL